jgi:hypothetical protein
MPKLNKFLSALRLFEESLEVLNSNGKADRLIQKSRDIESLIGAFKEEVSKQNLDPPLKNPTPTASRKPKVIKSKTASVHQTKSAPD